MYLSNALLPSQQNRVLAEAAGGGGRQDGDACKADDYQVHRCRQRQQRFRVLTKTSNRGRGGAGWATGVDGNSYEAGCNTDMHRLGRIYVRLPNKAAGLGGVGMPLVNTPSRGWAPNTHRLALCTTNACCVSRGQSVSAASATEEGRQKKRKQKFSRVGVVRTFGGNHSPDGNKEVKHTHSVRSM